MIFALLVFILFFGILAYHRASAIKWTGGFAAYLLIFSSFYGLTTCMSALWIAFVIFSVIINVPIIRRLLITNHVLKIFQKILPPMSSTEKEALDAGTVWWDGDLFSGDPDWEKLLKHDTVKLSEEEQAFVDGPVNELCKLIDDWKISQELNDLPPEVWEFIKKNKFFGMIIPKKYGGLEFSALAHSAIVMKVSTRSAAAAVTVMVPNSLGPAELLLRYGTEAQKDHYLPRLAIGEDVPCFALTSPEAGSDASSIPDLGIICKQDYKGKKDVLGIRITWEKRYITLGPVATVLGLAFQTTDPDGLLGDQKELGITCALIPTSHEGVNIGRRHHPGSIAFQNGPNSGDDVFIPMNWVIGGEEQVGHGWRMLMNCLAAGRSISLPALSVGGVKFTSRAIGAFARVRKQFRMPIGRFEGVEEPLARMAGYAYMVDAARILTASALDHGESPSVLSAVLKYQLTERMRKAVNDAMDIQAGSAICMGPNNILAKLYHAIPISITVEGANILTRTLIVFGQGAIRCHPYVFKEIQAASEPNKQKASIEFDEAFSGHVLFTTSNFVRTLSMGLTNGRLISVPDHPQLENYYQDLTRISSAFALLADAAMFTLGGALKRKEKLSGRFADVLSLLYLASASLKRFEDQGRADEDLPLIKWVCDQCLYEMQEAISGILQNFPNPIISKILQWTIFPYGKRFLPPTDQAGHELASILMSPSDSRDRLTVGIYLPTDESQQVARLEEAFIIADEADVIEKRIIGLKKQGQISGRTMPELLKQADQKVLITDQEAKLLARFIELKDAIIKVDDFAANEFNKT